MAKQKGAAESAAAGNPIKRKIRKNDQVLVLSGKNRGARGRVLRVLAAAGKAVVEHVNRIKRHTRPNPNKGIQGGILEREGPIQISNLMLVCSKCNRPTRVGYSFLADGSKARVCKKCGEQT